MKLVIVFYLNVGIKQLVNLGTNKGYDFDDGDRFGKLIDFEWSGKRTI